MNKRGKKESEECAFKPGFRCPILNCRIPTKRIINMIQEGRCYAEMCPHVETLIFNNPYDGFGRNVDYKIEQFSIKSLKEEAL